MAGGLELLVVAKGGNVNFMGFRRQQYCGAGGSLYRDAIDGQIYLAVAHDSTLTASNLQES